MSIPIWVTDPTGNNNPYLKIVSPGLFLVFEDLETAPNAVDNTQTAVHLSDSGTSWTTINITGFSFKSGPLYLNGCWGIPIQTAFSIISQQVQTYDSFIISVDGHTWTTKWSDPSAAHFIQTIGIDPTNNQFVLSITDLGTVNIPVPVTAGKFPYPRYTQVTQGGQSGTGGVPFPDGWQWQAILFGGDNLRHFYLTTSSTFPGFNPDVGGWQPVLDFNNTNSGGSCSFAIQAGSTST